MGELIGVWTLTTENELPSFWTHPDGDSRVPHKWRYLGKGLGYHCVTCGLRLTKEALKEGTDA